jgi:hypothetical protein
MPILTSPKARLPDLSCSAAPDRWPTYKIHTHMLLEMREHRLAHGLPAPYITVKCGKACGALQTM